MCPDRKNPDPTTLSLPAGALRIHLSTFRQDGSNASDTCQPVTLIGSRRDCDLYIGDSDISKTHCALINTGTSVIATDLCTRAGTFVNGQQISAAKLRTGDVLRIGTELVKVHFTPPAYDSAYLSDRDGFSERVLKSPLRISETDQQFRIDVLPAVIGRRHTCQVVVDTPDVSLTHGLIFRMSGRLVICDLGSRSGIHLNNQRVTLAWLENGDQLSIGGETLVLTFDEPRLDQLNERALANDLDETSVSAMQTSEAVQPDRGRPLEDQGIYAPDLAAVSDPGLEQRAAALDQRETRLNEKQARLEAAEQELNRRAADLARRENDNHSAALKIAQVMESFSEAWRLYCAGSSIADSGYRSDLRTGSTTGTKVPLQYPEAVPGDQLPTNESLPAPLVDQAIFPNLDGTRPA